MTKKSNIGPRIGGGIYTISDVGLILGKPYQKVNRWVKEYWNSKFNNTKFGAYTWSVDGSIGLNFNTLVEIVVFAELRQAGVSIQKIIKAHNELRNQLNTKYPFANKKVIKGLGTDGFKIYFNDKKSTITLDGTRQLNFDFIVEFFKNIDFDKNNLASRYWPMGRKKSIVVDPEHQLGQPVINGTNILPASIYSMYKAGEKANVIAFLYEIKLSQVKDAIQFCKNAA